MARAPGVASAFQVTAVPLFLGFRDGKLVYRGAMGGSAVVALPSSNRRPNALLVEPQAKHRISTEKALGQAGSDATTVGGRCDATSGEAVGVALAARGALDLQKHLNASATTRVRASKGQLAGTDATA